jgi:hypothetical protein
MKLIIKLFSQSFSLFFSTLLGPGFIVRTNRFNIKKFFILSTQKIYGLYESQNKYWLFHCKNISWLVVRTKSESKDCALRVELVNVIQANSRP